MDTTTLTACFTKAERRVLGGFLEGKSCKEIANDSCKSVRTVENQVRSMFDKTGVHSLHELVSLWYKEQFDITAEDLRRRLGAMVLLGLFTAFTFAGSPDDLPNRARTARRTRTEQVARRARKDL